MKTPKWILLLPVLLFMSFTAFTPELSTAERKLAIDYLTRTKDDLLKSLSGLSSAQLNFKSDPDSWSVAECAEHIAISESNLTALIQGTLKEPSNPGRRGEVKLQDEDLFNSVVDRSDKVKTSEAFKPTGKFGSHEATVKEFLTKRDTNIDFIKNTSDDLRNHFFTFPVEALGTVDSYQLFLFVAAHSKRHTLQIDEIKNNPGFPKK